MKRYQMVFAGVLMVVAAIIAAFLAGGPDKLEEANPIAPSKAANSGRPLNEMSDRTVALSEAPAAPPNDAAPTPGFREAGGTAGMPMDAITDAIHETAISYDPNELPKIQPYLLHPDPGVRAAALEGMLVLGDAAASPLLRAAARQIAAPQEAVKMIEAADYLELPSGTLRASASVQGNALPVQKAQQFKQ